MNTANYKMKHVIDRAVAYILISDYQLIWESGLSVSDVARFMNISKPTAQKRLEEMFELGMINVQTCKNQRLFTVKELKADTVIEFREIYKRWRKQEKGF